MTQEARNNAEVLYELGIDRQQEEESQNILHLGPELPDIFRNPVVLLQKKQSILEKVFSKSGSPKQLIRFLQVMCDHGEMDEIDEIYQAYYEKWDEVHHIKRVCCTFAKEPEAQQLEQIRKFLQTKYEDSRFVFEIRMDPDILGGAVITLGHEEYDWSLEGRIRQLRRVLTER